MILHVCFIYNSFSHIFSFTLENSFITDTGDKRFFLLAFEIILNVSTGILQKPVGDSFKNILKKRLKKVAIFVIQVFCIEKLFKITKIFGHKVSMAENDMN